MDGLTVFVFLHIAAGAVAIGAGAAAFGFAKGSRRHKTAGRIFVWAMLAMAGGGFFLALARPAAPSTNTLAAAATLYLVATAWLTMRPRGPHSRLLDLAALAFALAAGAVGISHGMRSPFPETGLPGAGMPAGVFFMFATVVMLGAVGDLRMLIRGGIAGSARLFRHVWRMGFAMFIAAASFFAGQADEFPAAVRATGLLPVPVFAVIALTLFWMFRVKLARKWRGPKRTPTPAVAA